MPHDSNVLVYAVRAGAVVHVSEVPSGRYGGCRCPSCDKFLVAKKGPVMTHHFAHDAGDNCGWESALHDVGKRLLEHRIRTAIERGEGLPVRSRCGWCNKHHEGNLLRRARRVELEKVLGEARPDVLLSEADGRPVAALEVVVTHAPEDQALAFYRREGIEVLTFHLSGQRSQEALVNGTPLAATSGTYCDRKKCRTCRSPLFPPAVHVVNSKCWKCDSPMRVAWKEHPVYGVVGPDEFTRDDLALARAAGCDVRSRWCQRARRMDPPPSAEN